MFSGLEHLKITCYSLTKVVILFTLISASMFSHSAPPAKHVAVTQIVEHPSLDAVRQGVKDVLEENEWIEGTNLKWEYQSAQGNIATATQIAKKFAGSQADVILAIATPSAQAAAASARRTNIIFSAVTDPVAAKLVKSWDKPGKRITGVSDLTPIDKHLAMIKRILPSVGRLGVIYNPGEANSVALVKRIKQLAPAQELEIIEAAAPKSADVQTAARSLVGRVEAIYLPTDNTVISALEGIVKVAEQLDIPLFAGDTDSVKRGAIAALGFNYYQVGRQTGELLTEVLKGKSPSTLPVQGIDKTELFVNLSAAEKMGVQIPKDLLSEAHEIIQ